MFLFTDLRDEIKAYLEHDDVIQVCQAFLVAFRAHDGQVRRSGEPYICHPIEVARILASMKMDAQTIMAALMHDVIEDTEVTKEDIAKLFGDEVANLIDGVTKLKQISFRSKIEQQAENFRKMMLAMVKDVRVILVKLADRLHNMRTLGALPPSKKRRIARETLDIYAPIAHRLGMHNIRLEFEDLGFQSMYPMRYRTIRDSVHKARGNRHKIIEKIEEELKEHLKKHQIDYIKLSGREKHYYSIYKKMLNKGLSFNEVMDVYAFRVLLNNRDNCYRTLGSAHALYKPVPGRFKDYIAIPKANGYQSLHTTLFGPYGVPIEIQIRTKKMHQVAEVGIAAHWLYKEGNTKIEASTARWLKGVEEIQEHSGSSLEFIEDMKGDLFPGEVYIFSPKGKIFALPNGSTAVDFAYAVHTHIGNACIASKIDNRLMPLSTPLMTGQTVEIITAPAARPNPAWLSFVVTGKARGNIRHHLKNQQLLDAIELGKALLERALTHASIDLDALSQSTLSHSLLRKMEYESLDKLYADIGIGHRTANMVAQNIHCLHSPSADLQQTGNTDTALATAQPAAPLLIKGTEGMVVSFAKCCYPIPGDEVIGCLNAGRGIIVHRTHCKNALLTLKRNPEHCIQIDWSPSTAADFSARVRVEMSNFRGALGRITTEIADADSNIEHIHSDESDERYFIVTLTLSVRNRVHLARVMRRLKGLRTTLRIYRLK
ncbi:Bifunctional (p)ppGpp synthase/hydrolase SpoT [Piscirickettsia salmonis]|uniref:guanosine-3',5'-bis(diphosphate) 3'-diphosphatase n=1 Tax=Piscirickettsia salmonis TaxID=1238 RepID=A0A1L6TDE5_PISSA|nr:bifunctional (p)ppGpp synthetase/guanosine-3',5'-bis(diphosphate) 3'-pyrophosphohydrolase [Piscirickettsia salmonis]AKP74417.1 (p)ppGpp synthetase [Piscirickettsia salmonis LF-89 = ATCC VR-1361]ALB23372.1 bifunctional (p)ppGpp synthase/hydrolase SpoT [Piscirickettsia salmonis]ALY03263.1 (p)ppGpp synthetase [Piscirickettsia salmonis]AMA42830.1 (p)ppGpp synthetase [Piscirickettsia salmonis]AOS35298.1 (p)ppGpp synthetase [Piscirickettsia salmonis]